MKLLADLIKIKSYSGQEQELAKYISDYMKSLGLKPIEHDGNVVIYFAGKDQSKSLIFNAHMDTVSEGDPSHWQHPPFGPEAGVIEDGKIYGLGASDEKASVAALCLLAEKLTHTKPACDVWLTFVVEEEIGGTNGMGKFIQWWQNQEEKKNVAGVICEPTNLETIGIGCRGFILLKVRVKGDSGHGSRPDLIKEHAIHKMIKVIEDLKQIDKNWQKKYVDPTLGKPSLAVTNIVGGSFDSPNKFAGSCAISIDIRTTPKLHKLAFKELQQKLKKYQANIELLYDIAHYAYTDPKSKVVRTTQKLLPSAKITVSSYSHDGSFFSEVGIPFVVLGPGYPKIMHKPDEYCEPKKIEEAVEVYQKIIENY